MIHIADGAILNELRLLAEEVLGDFGFAKKDVPLFIMTTEPSNEVKKRTM